MSKTFDELFNDFFSGDDDSEPNGTFNAEKINDILSSLGALEDIDEAVEKNIDESLGKPDKVEFYEENDLYYEKRIWHTSKGDFVKLIIRNTPPPITDVNPYIKPSSSVIVKSKSRPIKVTLQEQLDEAVLAENYEMAAELRDLINKEKK